MDRKEKHLFDKPHNVKRILRSLYVICALLFAMDFIVARHMMHSWENLGGFYAIYGFVSCVLLVLIAKWLRTFLMRPENYYDREELKGMENDGNVDA